MEVQHALLSKIYKLNNLLKIKRIGSILLYKIPAQMGKVRTN